MSIPATRLFLVTSILSEVEPARGVIEAACRSDLVDALLVRLSPGDERGLVNRLKAIASVTAAAGVALVLDAETGGVADPVTVAARGGADGLQVAGTGRLRELRERLGPDRTLGACSLRSRHDAMEAGEAGADYVLFGEPWRDGSLPELADVEERAAWWAEIFQVPCVAYAGDLASVPRLAGTGAEFVALAPALWEGADGAASVREAAAALAAPRELVP